VTIALFRNNEILATSDFSPMITRWKIPLLIVVALLLAVVGTFLWHPQKKIEEKIIRVFDREFKCTLYYTPREAGFTKEAGFDVESETRPGLNGARAARDFLVAVEKEGCGRLKEPFENKPYVQYYSGRWKLTDRPADRNGNPLVAKQTCAVSKRHAAFDPNTKLSLTSPKLPQEFRKYRWIASDTGSGLEEWQLDLYWGEDDPAGPGDRLSRPKGVAFDVSTVTVALVK
jgi:hypothetical protein